MTNQERAEIEMVRRQCGMDPVETRVENLIAAMRSNGPEVARCLQELVDAAYKAAELSHSLASARESTCRNRFDAIEYALLRLREAVKRFDPVSEP